MAACIILSELIFSNGTAPPMIGSSLGLKFKRLFPVLMRGNDQRLQRLKHIDDRAVSARMRFDLIGIAERVDPAS
jgi:hypothetical protein